MAIVLEIKGGPLAGKVISLKSGESVTIGRAAAKSQFALAQDTFMSGLHFAVECGAQGSRVIDRKSSNGTFLNGHKLRENEPTPLAGGDEIKAGQTIFAVKLVADERLAPTGPVKPVAPPAEAPPPQPPSVRPQEPPSRQPSGQRSSSIFEEPLAKPPAPPPRPPSTPSQPDAPVRARVDAERVRPSTPPEPRREEPRPSGGEKLVDRPLGAPAEERPQFHDVPGSTKPPRRIEPPPPPPAVAPKPPRRDEFPPRPVDRAPSRSRDFAFHVMGWTFPAAPAEWQVQEGFGLQRAAQEEFPSSVAVTEEPLGGITLQQFVESQISTLRGYLRDARIEPVMPPRVGGADESMAVDVRHSTKDGKELVHRWIYARSGSSVGMLTVTALATELPQVLQSLQTLLDGAAFQSTVNA